MRYYYTKVSNEALRSATGDIQRAEIISADHQEYFEQLIAESGLFIKEKEYRYEETEHPDEK